MGARVAKDREEQLHERLIRCVVRSPDNIQYLIQLLLCLCLPDHVSLSHGSGLAIASSHGDIGQVK